MDDNELRAAFAATNAAIAATNATIGAMSATIDATGTDLRTEMRAMSATIDAMGTDLRTEMRAGFAKHDGYFGMLHKEQVDGFNRLDVRLSGVEDRLERVEQEVFGVTHEFHRFRDWVDEKVRDLRSSITQLTGRFETMG